MSTNQFSGKVTPSVAKDPRASVVSKDPRATNAARPIAAPSPLTADSRGRRAITIAMILLVALSIAGVSLFATRAQQERATQSEKEESINANNELMVKLGQMQNAMNQMQTMISQQDLTIKQMRSEIQSCKNSVESVRSAYITMQSKGAPK